MSTIDVLRRITAKLEEAGVEYMLSGSFASAYYGTPRATQDIDLVVSGNAEQLSIFVKLLPLHEYYADADAAIEAYRRQSLFNVIDLATGWKIDLIICKARPFSKTEFGRRRRIDLQGLQVYVASAEDLVIAKLEWSKLAQSRRQIEDVATILALQCSSMDRDYLEKWLTELDLENEWNEAARIAGI